MFSRQFGYFVDDSEDEDDEEYDAAALDGFYDRFYEEEDDGESGLESLARRAAEIEAGEADVPTGWQLDTSHPGMLVWTTPAGRRYASTLTGEPLPLP